MSAPLSFSAACSQLVNAGCGVVSAAWRAPFTGGKLRMVTVGIPVLFATAGAGAAIYAVMRSMFSAVYSNATSYAQRFFQSRNVIPIYPPEPNPAERKRVPTEHPVNSLAPPPEIKHRDSVGEASEPVALAPLPQNAAEQRNNALLKFLDLVDKYLIEPWILNNEKLLRKAEQTRDPFLAEMIGDRAALKAWLRSIALWGLGKQWDQIETKYVKMETPAPPTLESLELQVQAAQLERGLCDALIQQLQSEEERRVTAFQDIVTRSGLPQDKKLHLMGIWLQFDAIVRQEPEDLDAKNAATEKVRTNFAMIMHHGMAISMTQISVMIEGWMAVIQQMSPQSPRPVPKGEQLESEKIPEDLMNSHIETDVARIVKKTSAVLSNQLSEQYLLPLWEKQQGEWKRSIGEELGTEGVQKDDPAHRLVNSFINNPKMTEAEFLLTADSYGLSTSLTSNIAFFRSIQIMQAKQAALKGTIRTLPASLFLQIESILTGTLHKSAKMMSEINLKTTVPRIVDYALGLLGCCRAMQSLRDEAGEPEEVVYEPGEDSPLMRALTKGNQNVEAAAVETSYSAIPKRVVTGQAVIGKLESAHKAVRLSQPEIQERTWIHATKERLEGLLRVKAAEYAREPEGQWLATLLKSKPNGNGGTSLIGSLLSLQNKLWKLIPGTESLTRILLLGVQTFIEEEACEGIQKQLNELTSTGFLSETIGITVVQGLIDQSKEDKDWRENLPLLQQAFAFLLPEEQKSVLKHLSAQFSEAKISDERRKGLMTPPENSISLNDDIAKMKREERLLTESLETIAKAHKVLMQDEAENLAEIASLKEAYGKIKREKDLKQFARIKGLVIHVVDETLAKKLNFAYGPNLKQIILAVIHEAYTLLSYQEVVKHWIFTIVDLLLDELEEATSPRRDSQPRLVGEASDAPLQTRSMLEFIKPEQKSVLLEQLCQLMITSSSQEDSGWFNVASWIKSGAKAAASWAPQTVWGYIEEAFKEDLRVTPPDLTKMALEKLEAFATDTSGLADTVIKSLMENVADTRSKEVVDAQNESLLRSFPDLAKSDEKAKEREQE